MARKKRKVEEINSSSTADMAFLLLIFFLMTTTMNVDSGIQRFLPPIADVEAEADVNKRNLLIVNVSQYNQVQMAGQVVELSQIAEKVKEFVLNPYDEPDKAAMKEVEIPMMGGMYLVSEGIVSLTNHRGTSYNLYIQVQNELTKAFNEIRDDVSNRYFGANFKELNEEQQDAVKKAVPVQISEAEPVNIGEV